MGMGTWRTYSGIHCFSWNVSAVASEIHVRGCVAHEIVHSARGAALHPGMLDVGALPHSGHRALFHGCVTDLVEDHPESLGLEITDCRLR